MPPGRESGQVDLRGRATADATGVAHRLPSVGSGLRIFSGRGVLPALSRAALVDVQTEPTQVVAGFTVGASKGYVYLRAEYPLTRTIFQQALAAEPEKVGG